jgi:hypothetical protein
MMVAPFVLTGSNALPIVAVWTPIAVVLLLLLRGLCRAVRGLSDPLKT